MSRVTPFLHPLTPVLLLLVIATGCSGGPKRAERSMTQLLAARAADDVQRQAERQSMIDRLLTHAKAEQDAAAASGNPTTRPTIDILVISGGGDWGAFGAGVLKGWGRAPGPTSRPTFDVVTGVSTGALIAPFAYLGDNASIERVVTLYRNPRSDWAKPRGTLYFWPTNPSFYALPGLEREVKKAVDMPTLQRLVDTSAQGRILLVNTTNVDFGDMHAWDIPAEAKRSLDSGDGGAHVRKILLASAGVPAAFPSRVIGDSLYVDGAITGNILYGGRVRDDSSFWAFWQQRFPNDPVPTFRYWVIFNNQLRFPPQITQPRWPAIVSRATIMSTQNATVNSIRHLFALAEIAKLKRNANVEVRVISVPDAWIPPNPRVFDKDVMNSLADLGEQLGADPASWRTESP